MINTSSGKAVFFFFWVDTASMRGSAVSWETIFLKKGKEFQHQKCLYIYLQIIAF